MAAGDLTTVEDVKAYLGLSPGSTDDDALLARLVTAASDFITTATGRLLGPTSKTDTFDGDGGSRHLCTYWPVTAVTSVTVDGAAVPVRTTVAGNGYVIDGDAIRLVGYSFDSGVLNCAIVYTAGLAAVPGDVAQATIELAAYRYKAKDRISIANKTLPQGEVVSFVGYQASTASVDAVIDAYRALRAG